MLIITVSLKHQHNHSVQYYEFSLTYKYVDTSKKKNYIYNNLHKTTLLKGSKSVIFKAYVIYSSSLFFFLY